MSIPVLRCKFLAPMKSQMLPKFAIISILAFSPFALTLIIILSLTFSNLTNLTCCGRHHLNARVTLSELGAWKSFLNFGAPCTKIFGKIIILKNIFDFEKMMIWRHGAILSGAPGPLRPWATPHGGQKHISRGKATVSPSHKGKR